MESVIEISCPEMHVGTPFIRENANMRDKQTVLYYKRAAIFRRNHF